MNLGNRKAQHNFAVIPQVNMARSVFDRSFSLKTTFDFDYLVPILVDEVLPGDTANLSLKTFGRLSTQLVPIMDNLYIDYHFFFVPNRLVWDNWEKMCGAQDNPADSIDYTLPVLTVTGVLANGSIFDHMGLPTDVANAITVSNALPLRAYYKIWNDWFRDENLQNSVTLYTDDGPDLEADYTLQKRGRRHDYFTSCLPWPQKGTAIDLPLGSTAPILGIGLNAANIGATPGSVSTRFSDGTTSSITSWTIEGADSPVAASQALVQIKQGTAGYPDIYADLSGATSATINEFREAILLQSMLELAARGGTRYVEILRTHFNVISPDFRLQRAEYLGGGSSRINSHPVAQQSPTSGSNYFAQLGAFGTTSNDQHIGFSKSFVEHGWIIGLASARADISYQQGLERFWSRSTKYDFFWPKLQELGEQAVLNKEIYANGDANDVLVWGYQERYAEYRYKPSQIHGQFRSTYTTPLDMWHMAEEFGSLPSLNAAYIVSTTPITRALANSSAPHILLDAWFNYRHARPMQTYSTPASLGRF